MTCIWDIKPRIRHNLLSSICVNVQPLVICFQIERKSNQIFPFFQLYGGQRFITCPSKGLCLWFECVKSISLVGILFFYSSQLLTDCFKLFIEDLEIIYVSKLFDVDRFLDCLQEGRLNFNLEFQNLDLTFFFVDWADGDFFPTAFQSYKQGWQSYFIKNELLFGKLYFEVGIDDLDGNFLLRNRIN